MSADHNGAGGAGPVIYNRWGDVHWAKIVGPHIQKGSKPNQRTTPPKKAGGSARHAPLLGPIYKLSFVTNANLV
jgi:hypothetical protein